LCVEAGQEVKACRKYDAAALLPPTQPRVLVSFAKRGGYKSQSFPRKACPELTEGQKSPPQTFGNALSTNWIPIG
jgi:hypothetical protein